MPASVTTAPILTNNAKTNSVGYGETQTEKCAARGGGCSRVFSRIYHSSFFQNPLLPITSSNLSVPDDTVPASRHHGGWISAYDVMRLLWKTWWDWRGESLVTDFFRNSKARMWAHNQTTAKLWILQSEHLWSTFKHIPVSLSSWSQFQSLFSDSTVTARITISIRSSVCSTPLPTVRFLILLFYHPHSQILLELFLSAVTTSTLAWVPMPVSPEQFAQTDWNRALAARTRTVPAARRSPPWT